MDIALTVPFSPQPLGWSFQAYNLLTLVLSSIFIVCLFIMYSISRSVSILPHAFRMVTLEKRRMHCFDVDITSGRQAHKVRMLYMWMLRAAILVMFCFVWQYCVVSYKAIDFSHRLGPMHLYLQCVRWESDCFGEKQHHRFFNFSANPTNVCTHFQGMPADQMDKVLEQISEQHRYLLCMHFISPDAMVYTAGLSIAFALGYVVLTGFEVLVWLLYRATERWLPLLVFTLGILVFAFWIGSIFIPQFFTFFGCWISFIMVLTVPWILWLALAAAYNLRKLQHQKWALWQEQANRPLNQLMDRGKRDSEASGQVLAARGSREASGGDMDMDMDELAALKASKICNQREENELKKEAEARFELPNLRGIKVGLRQKKEKPQQLSQGESASPPLAQPDASEPNKEAKAAKEEKRGGKAE
ncbi:hypothetical protein Efla_004242 [Eimeria flavescens]